MYKLHRSFNNHNDDCKLAYHLHGHYKNHNDDAIVDYLDSDLRPAQKHNVPNPPGAGG